MDGEVALGPSTDRSVAVDGDDVVVLASGNLGLVSFPRISGRASLQQIESAHPGLVDVLRRREGVGLALVRDKREGDMVFGPGEHITWTTVASTTPAR